MKRIAVFTSGGDAPGMNAAVRAVVRAGIHRKLDVYGIERGYQGMIEGKVVRLDSSSVGNIIHRGGTFLRTARSMDFMTKEGRAMAFETLQAYDIDGVVAIGGNGTFTGANVFSQEFDIPFVGLPGTIDNDLYGTDFTIGFDTAINTAIEAIDRIRDTADSHDRLFFVEVMGRNSGYIALYTGIGSGASGILLPEKRNDVDELVKVLKKGAKRNKLFSLVVVAEGDESGGALKMAERIKDEFPQYETKVSILGHIQRGGSPSCADRVLASRLGCAAVEALIEGKRNVMVGQMNNRVVLTPFEDAIQKDKPFTADLLQIAEMLSL
jgi:6-phosphofructokinase 1